MPTCTTCDDNILNPSVAEKPFCISCAEQESKCGLGKFPADCVIYHIDDEAPSKLPNIGAPNRASVSSILEALDKLVGQNFNTPLKANNSKTIRFTTSGTSNHTLTGSVKISPSLGNLLEEKEDGLYLGTSDLGKLRVKETGTLGYLADKAIGDTDGIVSISTSEDSDLLKISPSISVENLITDIRTHHLSAFNQLLSVSNVTNNNNNSDGDNTVISIQTKLAPFVAYPYHGSLTNFDDTGKGKVDNGYDKIYICNGQNGTPDYRGRSPIGANIGVPGGELDSDTNPANPENLSISVGQKVGEYKTGLNSNNVPEHSHGYIDNGHYHYTVVQGGNQGDIDRNSNTYGIAMTSEHKNGNQDYDLVSNSGTPTLGRTSKSSIDIIIGNNSTLNEKHNNTHPVIGTVFIMYIP